MKVFLLPGDESLVQVICSTEDEVRITSGLCMNSDIDGWKRFGNIIIMSWSVYHYIAYNGFKEIYSKDYAKQISVEDYD